MKPNQLKIIHSQFVKSVPTIDLLPHDAAPEIVFIGRSNVGKSSLLNYLANMRGLARVSRTPGRTQVINLFDASIVLTAEDDTKQTRSIRLVDLPGIGYAKVSHANLERMSKVMSDYISVRSTMKCIFHLLDCRRQSHNEDVAISAGLKQTGVPYFIVLTKTDKLPVSKRKLIRDQIARDYGCVKESVILSSTTKRLGGDEILASIWQAVCD